jgi:hypothetical protein
MGKVEGAEAFDRVVIRRKDVKRSRLEVARNGKVTTVDKLLDTQPRVTPNIAPEPTLKSGAIVFIPFNELGCIARTTAFPYHYAWDDSLCYMFPVFTKAAVRVGDVWDYSFPAIVGTEFGNNTMTIKAVFTLVDISRLKVAADATGPVCAEIDYRYFGLLDTAHGADAHKKPENAPGLLWKRDVVEGEGKAYFDIEAGKLLWRKESYRIEVARDLRQPVRAKGRRARADDDSSPPDREYETVEYRSEITVEFACRLLTTGERADSRPSRIE